jgi:adenine C2-methylase RlmN of 23S rRNA A2503 and tRNA A37
MRFYRVVFANNTVLSCEEEKHIKSYDEEVYYQQQDNGRLIFAYIKADHMVDANDKAYELIEQLSGAVEK